MVTVLLTLCGKRVRWKMSICWKKGAGTNVCICGSPEELCLGDGARRVREQHPGAAPGQHPPLAPRTARHFEVNSALFGRSIWNIFEGILKHFKIRFVIIRGFMFFSEN